MSIDMEFHKKQFYQEVRESLENVSENILKVELSVLHVLVVN